MEFRKFSEYISALDKVEAIMCKEKPTETEEAEVNLLSEAISKYEEERKKND